MDNLENNPQGYPHIIDEESEVWECLETVLEVGLTAEPKLLTIYITQHYF